MNKRKVGSVWEDRAVRYLRDAGVTIIERNYRCHIGEIDIIGLDRDSYVFVEVKYRKGTEYGCAVEAVTPRKQQIIRSVAQVYLTQHGLPEDTRVRFDVCGFDDGKITYIKYAF